MLSRTVIVNNRCDRPCCICQPVEYVRMCKTCVTLLNHFHCVTTNRDVNEWHYATSSVLIDWTTVEMGN